MWCKQKKNSIKEVICVLHSSFWMVTYTLADKCYQTCVDIPNTKADNSLYISWKLLSSLECKLWEMRTKCLPLTYIFLLRYIWLLNNTKVWGTLTLNQLLGKSAYNVTLTFSMQDSTSTNSFNLELGSTIICILKNNAWKWTCAIQTCVVQGLTACAHTCYTCWIPTLLKI